MKRKALMLGIFASVLLSSCGNSTSPSVEIENNNSSLSSEVSEEVSSSDITSSVDSVSSEESVSSNASLTSETSSSSIEENDNSSSSSSTSSESISSSSSSSSTSSSSSSTSSSSSSSSSESEVSGVIPSSGQELPIGNKTTTGPSNSESPIDIAEWYNVSINKKMPEYWSYISGNNKVTPDFYSKGAVKFTDRKGIQSPVFTPYKKVEVRLTISETHGTRSNVTDRNKPIFHIYGYDKDGHYIYNDEILNDRVDNFIGQQGELKFYIRNINVCYFEVRMNSKPFNSSGNLFNIGVNKLSIKGWDYE